jgi:hypothetical protein
VVGGGSSGARRGGGGFFLKGATEDPWGLATNYTSRQKVPMDGPDEVAPNCAET